MSKLTTVLASVVFIGVAMLSPASLGQAGPPVESDGLPEVTGAADDVQALDVFAEWLRRFETSQPELLTENGRVSIAAANVQESANVLAEGVHLATVRQPGRLWMRD